MFNDRINYKRERVVRILAHFNNGNIGNGSGFFINDSGQLLTCFHVVFGGELKNIRTDQDFTSIVDDNEHLRLQKWFKNKIKKIEVGFPDGSKKELDLQKYDEKFDIALLKLKDDRSVNKIKYCQLDFSTTLKQGDSIFFAGFPICYSYKDTETPFAINTGIVSSFPKTIIGGERYKHIQINSINLGGNSGAPLFRKNRNKVIGIINGNMNLGKDTLVSQDKNGKQTVGPLRIPLGIAYATSLKTIKHNTLIFELD